MKSGIILIALIVFVVGIIGYYYANYKAKQEFIKQQEIYKDGLKCKINSLEELYEIFLNAKNLKISNINVYGEERLEITRNRCKHNFFMENGYIKLDYPEDDAAFIGRGLMAPIRQMKLHKKIQRIVDGNQLMDYLALSSSMFANKSLSYTHDYNNASKWKVLMLSSVAMLIGSVLLFMLGMEASLSDDYIEYVQNKEISSTSQITIGQVISFYLPQSQWKYFTSDDGDFIVEVSGVHQNVESDGVTELLIQFQYLGVEQKGDITSYTNVSLAYMEINGKACSKEEALENMNGLLEIYELYGLE